MTGIIHCWYSEWQGDGKKMNNWEQLGTSSGQRRWGRGKNRNRVCLGKERDKPRPGQCGTKGIASLQKIIDEISKFGEGVAS